MRPRGAPARCERLSRRPIIPGREWNRESDHWRSGNKAARTPLRLQSPRLGHERSGPRPRGRGIEAGLPDRDVSAQEFWQIAYARRADWQSAVRWHQGTKRALGFERKL